MKRSFLYNSFVKVSLFNMIHLYTDLDITQFCYGSQNSLPWKFYKEIIESDHEMVIFV